MSIGSLRLAALLSGLTVLVVLCGGLIGGAVGAYIVFGLALLSGVAAYWVSDRVALALVGGRELALEEAPELHRLVDKLAMRSGLPKPRLYVIESPAPNAFATGRDPAHAVVGLTMGLIRILTRDELAGVLAHELAHIRNRDTLMAALVATLAGVVTVLTGTAQWGLFFGGSQGKGDGEATGGSSLVGAIGGLLFILLVPIAVLIIRLSISRSREYDADRLGASFLGDPLPLARALEKLDLAGRAVPLAVNPAVAHQFTVHPFAPGQLRSLFNTHPPTTKRVTRLREMALRPTVNE